MARRPAETHGVLVVDKPLGWTSRDVVNKLGWCLGEREVGHAGTLDPQASGVLLLTVGEGGKLVRWLQDHDKTYVTDIALGTATLTDDAAGPVVREAPLPERVDPGLIQSILDRWQGWVEQVPPQVSALQQDGVRDHERVRRGETVVRPPRRVWLAGAQVLAVGAQSIRLQVTCGAGFYVRSLARDLGEALGTAAHVATLRRTAAGGFGLDVALPVEVLQAMPRETLRDTVVPLLAAAARVLPVWPVDATTALALRQGKRPHYDGHVAASAEGLVTCDGEAVAIVGIEPLAESQVQFTVVRGFSPPSGAASQRSV